MNWAVCRKESPRAQLALTECLDVHSKVLHSSLQPTSEVSLEFWIQKQCQSGRYSLVALVYHSHCKIWPTDLDLAFGIETSSSRTDRIPPGQTSLRKQLHITTKASTLCLWSLSRWRCLSCHWRWDRHRPHILRSSSRQTNAIHFCRAWVILPYLPRPPQRLPPLCSHPTPSWRYGCWSVVEDAWCTLRSHWSSKKVLQ